MPKLTGSFAQLSLDVEGLKRELDRQCSDLLVRGAREWVQTVVDIVPFWSGESRGSLQPFAEKVGVTVFATNVVGAPNRVSKGRSEALPPPVLNLGDNNQYFFEWHTQVAHFIYNEFNDANATGYFNLNNPGPYHSMEKAERAFFATVNPGLATIQLDIGAHVRVIRVQFR